MRICLIGPFHLSSNPRLVREANILAEAGHEVIVVTPRYLPRLVHHDQMLLANARWQHLSVDCRGRGSAFWLWVRLRRRLYAALARHLVPPWILRGAGGYAFPELERVARSQRANLYIAHTQMTLPLAAQAARSVGAAVAVDIEDLLADCSAENGKIMRAIERRYLPGCHYISTMSGVAAGRLRELYDLPKPPMVLHNTPSLSERKGVGRPDQRGTSPVPSLYWFGQTVGAHSCADQVLTAIGQMNTPLRLVLRGNPDSAYVKRLDDLARSLKLTSRLEVMPLAAPDQMVRLAAEHDLALGSQPSRELFHQMAIGNKVFTGMMAGLALVLTDTLAHRELMTIAPGCGFTFPLDDVPALASELDRVASNRQTLQEMKQRSWQLAEQEFNWEREAQQLLTTVGELA